MGPEFDRSLRCVARPALDAAGFEFDGRRRFVKVDAQGEGLVIEYQVGVRAMQGRFAVNLIVHGRTERLAMHRPTLMSRLVERLFGDYDPWWKGIFLPKDDWWRISPFQKEMDAVVAKTVKDLEAYGIAWLENAAGAVR